MRLADICPNVPDLRERFVERFWSKVDIGESDDCWPWQACTCGHGKAQLNYGRFGVGGGRTMTAHRVAYLLTRGEVDDGLFVCHECDYPPCCNPAHLFEGTGKENAADRDRKGRAVIGYRPAGENHFRAAFSNEQAVEVLRLVLHDGLSRAEVSRRFGVSTGTIEYLAAGKGYPDAWEIFLETPAGSHFLMPKIVGCRA